MILSIQHVREALHGLDGGMVGGWILLVDLILFTTLLSNWERAAAITIRSSRHRMHRKP